MSMTFGTGNQCVCAQKSRAITFGNRALSCHMWASLLENEWWTLNWNLLAIVGTGVALAELNISQISNVRCENCRSEERVSSLRKRTARVESTFDVIRAGMQLPRPSAEPDSDEQAG